MELVINTAACTRRSSDPICCLRSLGFLSTFFCIRRHARLKIRQKERLWAALQLLYPPVPLWQGSKRASGCKRRLLRMADEVRRGGWRQNELWQLCQSVQGIQWQARDSAQSRALSSSKRGAQEISPEKGKKFFFFIFSFNAGKKKKKQGWGWQTILPPHQNGTSESEEKGEGGEESAMHSRVSGC